MDNIIPLVFLLFPTLVSLHLLSGIDAYYRIAIHFTDMNSDDILSFYRLSSYGIETVFVYVIDLQMM